MSHHMKVARQLQSRGYRLTPQRLAILEVIKGAGCHMTIQEVLDALADAYPTLSLPTVYRNLQWLKVAGLVTETDMGGECHEYEYICDSPHHHLVCLECGHRTELPDSLLDPLREHLQERGYLPHAEHYAFFGICPVCQEHDHPHEDEPE
jgi:Fur family peroxide stress response transcriptional regulator